MSVRWITWSLGLAACGRIGFDAHAPGGGGGDAGDAGGGQVIPDVNAATVVGNRAFVTSTVHVPGTFGGIAGGDAICAAAAARGGLSGTFVAWLSTTTTDAIDRLAGARGWVRPDGAPVADLASDIVSGRMRYPLRIDELGNDLGSDPSQPYAITGTNSDGTSASTCNDWTSTAASGTIGEPWDTGSQWTVDDVGSCSDPAPLYCFGVDLMTPVTVPQPAGRRAFVSQTLFATNAGLAAADAACASDATTAGVPGTFLALLANGTNTPASRFSMATPWLRVDGIPLAADAASFLSGASTASLDLAADGAFVDERALTGGTANDAVDPAYTCNNWSNTSAQTVLGNATATGPDSFNETTNSCMGPFPVYCLEQ